MFPDRDVEEPNPEKKCNDDNPQNRQYEDSAGSMSISVKGENSPSVCCPACSRTALFNLPLTADASYSDSSDSD
jgi:hypothetical protein